MTLQRVALLRQPMASDAGLYMGKTGDLVEILKLASRNYRRMGMIGQIFRPDGTDLRDHSLNYHSHPILNAENRLLTK